MPSRYLTALEQNDFSTLPNFPAEIRAPQGTIPGVSSFQLHFASWDILTPGDAPDVLVAMNPAALKANLADVPRGATIIVNTDEFSTHLKRKLREIAINLRDRSDQGESEKQLIAYKDEQMKTVYRLLTLAYGTPVKEFEWAPRENGKYISTPRKYTPLEFYREYCSEAGNLQQDYVMLMNDPSRPYN